MIQEETIQEIETLLAEAKEGKITALVGLVLKEDGQLVTQICDVPDDNTVTMVGLASLLHRDLLTLTPTWSLGGEYGEAQ